MNIFLKLFGIVVCIYFIANGFSFLIKQKGFDLIAYLFYSKEYMDIRVWDLTGVTYGASVFMSMLYFSVPVYACFRLWVEKK